MCFINNSGVLNRRLLDEYTFKSASISFFGAIASRRIRIVFS